MAQYSYRWDSKDSEGFADLFTEDGVMERRVDGRVGISSSPRPSGVSVFPA